MNTVIVEKDELDKLVKQHLGQDCTEHPTEIAFAKELVDRGEWEALEEFLETFIECPGYSNLLFAVYQQWYLELISHPSPPTTASLNEVRQKVLKLDKTLYNSLLLSDPLQDNSLASVQTLRNTLVRKIACYMYRHMYPSIQWQPPSGSTPSRLVQLVARGLVYEQWERASSGQTTPTTSDCNPHINIWLQDVFKKRTSNLTVELNNNTPISIHQHPLESSLLPIPSVHPQVVPLLSKSAPSIVSTTPIIEPRLLSTPTSKLVPSALPNLPKTSTPKDTTVVTIKGKDPTFTPIAKAFKSRPKVLKATLLETITDKQTVRSIAISSDGRHLAVGPNSKALRIFDTQLDSEGVSIKEVYRHNKWHVGSIYCLAWSPSSDLLATGSNDRMINLLYKRPTESVSYEPCGNILNPDGVVRELQFIPEGLVAVGGGGLRILSPDRLTITYQSLSTDHTHCVCYLGEKLLATGDSTGRVTIWDVRQRVPVDCHSPLGDYTCVTSIDYCHGNVAFSTDTGTCYTFPLGGMALRGYQQWKPHGDTKVRSLRYSPEGAWLLTGADSGTVCITDSTTLQHSIVCRHDKKAIQARWWLPGNIATPTIATCSADATARIWKLMISM